MNPKHLAAVCALLIGWSGVVVVAEAADFGIFVDGGYATGNTNMNDLVDRRVDGARMTFDARHPSGTSSRASTKNQMQTQIEALNCGVGDTITICMVGHGRGGGRSTEESFYFALQGDRVSSEELKMWLAAATIDCQCEIHVVIFSCHSGAWINDLFTDSHVKSVFASCHGDQLTYADVFVDAGGLFHDDEDWMKGFIDGWSNAPAGATVGDALEEGAESGWAHVPFNFAGVQKPAGWQRGQFAVKAHVEKRTGLNPTRAKVRFWEPSWLRCRTFQIPVDGAVTFPKSFQACEWVEFNATFGAADTDGKPSRRNSEMTGNPVACPDPPSASILAHVRGINLRKRKAAVHTFRPNWLVCTEHTLEIEEGADIDSSVRRCSWIEQDVTVNDPDGSLTTTNDVDSVSPKVSVVAHVNNIQAGPNTIGVSIRRPAAISRIIGRSIKIRLRGKQRDVRNTLERCDNIRIKLCLRPVADRTYHVSEIGEVVGAFGFSFDQDAGVQRVISPHRVMPSFDPVIPSCALRNAGTQSLTAVTMTARIFESAVQVYSNSLVVPFIESESQTEVVFPEWSGGAIGDYRVEFAATVAGDENAVNNKLAMDFKVDTLDPPARDWIATHLDTGEPTAFTAVENSILLDGFGDGFPTSSGDSAAWLYQPMEGDFDTTAFLGTQQVSTVRAGFMARTEEDVDAAFVAVVVGPSANARVRLLVRPESGANVSEIGVVSDVDYPVWIRMLRQGILLVGQYSLDGETWLDVGVAEVFDFPASLLVGPVCYSGGASVHTAHFQDVSGFPSGSVVIQRPIEVDAFALGPDQIRIDWVDRSLIETGFAIDRAVDDGDFLPLVQVAPDTVTYTDSGLSPATTYAYRIRAMQPIVDERWSALASAVTFGDGLEVWSIANGVGDPYGAGPNGEAPVFSYFSGATPAPDTPPSLSFSTEGGQVFALLKKAPGVYDVQVEIEELDTLFGGTPFSLYTLGQDTPPGDYKLLLPDFDRELGFVRMKLSPVP